MSSFSILVNSLDPFLSSNFIYSLTTLNYDGSDIEPLHPIVLPYEEYHYTFYDNISHRKMKQFQ